MHAQHAGTYEEATLAPTANSLPPVISCLIQNKSINPELRLKNNELKGHACILNVKSMLE